MRHSFIVLAQSLSLFLVPSLASSSSPYEVEPRIQENKNSDFSGFSTDTAASQSSVEARGAFKLFVDPNSAAAKDLALLRGTDPEAARLIETIASQSNAMWFGEWNKSIEVEAKNLAKSAKQAGAHAVVVVYAIPHRDCGNHSAGGLEADSYRKFVQNLRSGLDLTPAYIILEPDALALTDCLNGKSLQERIDLLKFAVKELKKNPLAKVYLDIGHSEWLSADEAAARLRLGGIDDADGFSINVSNYQTNADSIRYGQDIRALVGNKNFVVDTSRNGRGPLEPDAWCNPRGRSLGRAPEAPTQVAGLDAYLWIKRPGESDGKCNGGPAAGQWWREIALELAANAIPVKP